MAKKLDTEKIISMFRDVHGNKYDYSIVDYVGYDVKVKIICNKHGIFEQTPHSHLNGRGCPQCGKDSAKQKTALGLDEFVRRARQVHGDKYDYSKVEYINKSTKVCIICPIHGEFWQTPDNHVFQKQGCHECGRIKSSNSQARTTDEFIEMATQKHNGKYSYPRTVYTRSNQKVIITCDKHGDFEQEANAHLNGCGCPKCGIKSTKEKITRSTEEFIEQIKKIHGDRFGFDHTEYHGRHSKVCITCKEHGDVFVLASSLLVGGGCPICSRKAVGEQLSSDKDEFVKKAVVVHGNRYDYSNVIYTNNRTLVEIVCDKHGSFWQSPHMHLRGNGCPQCHNSLGEESVSLFLDKHRIEYIRQYAILNYNLLCKNRKILIDFFLPKYNIAIEFNGVQHYKPIKLFGGEEKFTQQQERDMTLRLYCEQNKIKLIEISYLDIKNIGTILTKELRGVIK